MRFSFATWVRSAGLALTLFALPTLPMTAMHAETYEQDQSVLPLDMRPIVRWDDLSPDDLLSWFANERQETVLEIPEGSAISLKMEIENDLFVLQGTTPSDIPTLRLCVKKKCFIAKRGEKFMVKQKGRSWCTLEKALESAFETASPESAKIEWSQDEWGPVIYFRSTP